MKSFYYFFISLLLTACSSVKNIQQNPNCVVWRDQKIWGPASIEVINKKVSWIGGCRGMHWDCKSLKISLDDDNNVMAEEIPLGFIENNAFTFFPDHPFGHYVSSTDYKAILEEQIIKGGSLEYHFNQKCSANEAIIGAISVDIIDHIQKEKLK